MGMNALLIFGALIWGYLLGSFNFAILISNIRFRKDVRKFGSGNAGTTNVLRTFGKKYAIATYLGDVFKCIVAILTVRLLCQGVAAPWGLIAELAAGTGTFIGHCYPLYFGFKGGKGMAVGTAILALIDWRLFVGAVIVFIVVVLLSKMVGLASICGSVTFAALSVAFRFKETYFVVWAILMMLFTMYNHRDNLKRIANGTESKFGSKKTP